MPIHITQGDITEQDDDAIVNAANEALAQGGGVCGAIHAAAGPELAEVCREIGHCPTGGAVITPGFRLKARYVIHAVGPRWGGGDRGEAALLRQCYRSIFDRVLEKGLTSIALPAISTGIFGYPLKEATQIAVAEARNALKAMPELAVTFVCFDAATKAVYEEMFRETE